MKITKNEILKKLSTLDKEKFHIKKIGLFGSYSKGEETPNSDIDILIDLEDISGMYENLCEIREELEKLFPAKIDIITTGQFDYKYTTPLVQKYKEKVKNEIFGSVIYV